MSVFAVIASNEQQEMEAAINELYEDADVLRVSTSFWVVDCEKATPKEATEYLLSAKNGSSLRSFIVMPVTSYYGLHSKKLWDWLIAKGV